MKVDDIISLKIKLKTRGSNAAGITRSGGHLDLRGNIKPVERLM